MVRTFDEKTSDIGYDCAEIKAKYPSLILDTFQLAAITAIREGHHPLVTAHTGSGKTLPAEHAIEHFVGDKGKKVIYTAPIKSLSNQKFHEFKAKFPAISFGIMTGDVKFNPDADCVIMTTEILRNSLATDDWRDSAVGCVVFDEVHYINDSDRGKVWEECIMWLPPHVTMVMLSATIDRVGQFAEWIEGIKNKKAIDGSGEKKSEVWICSTGKRVVPLVHYTYITANGGDLRGLDKETRDFINGFIDTPKIVKNPDGTFVERNIVDTFKVAKLLGANDVKRSTVIHRVVTYLNENGMLPAICFVFSRKKANDMARQLSVNLLSGEESTIEHEVKTILKRLPNWEEYVRTHEYEEMIELMQRGIAVHHSGVIPVLREVVEIMFSRGYVKMLFATETFAVGVNMPTKTVLFTDIQKFSETQFRFLHPHEYTQMAGRAGRRGLDKVGHVIHLFNLYDGVGSIGQHVLKSILGGAPQTLRSKFAVGYDTILNLAADGNSCDLIERSLNFVCNSMIRYEIGNTLSVIDRQLSEKRAKMLPIESWQEKLAAEYEERMKVAESASKKNKQRLIAELKDFIQDTKKRTGADVNKILQKKAELVAMATECCELEAEKANVEGQLRCDVERLYCRLEEYGLITNDKLIMPIGAAARCFKEVDCLSWAVTLERNHGLFEDLSVSEFVGFLSMFAYEDDVGRTIGNKRIEKLVELFEVFDVVLCGEKWRYFADWCDATDDTQCKQIIVDSGLYAGEFVKIMLKINNICAEVYAACEIFGYTGLAKKVSEVAGTTLKSIVTAQSLYL